MRRVQREIHERGNLKKPSTFEEEWQRAFPQADTGRGVAIASRAVRLAPRQMRE